MDKEKLIEMIYDIQSAFEEYIETLEDSDSVYDTIEIAVDYIKECE